MRWYLLGQHLVDAQQRWKSFPVGRSFVGWTYMIGRGTKDTIASAIISMVSSPKYWLFHEPGWLQMLAAGVLFNSLLVFALTAGAKIYRQNVSYDVAWKFLYPSHHPQPTAMYFPCRGRLNEVLSESTQYHLRTACPIVRLISSPKTLSSPVVIFIKTEGRRRVVKAKNPPSIYTPKRQQPPDWRSATLEQFTGGDGRG